MAYRSSFHRFDKRADELIARLADAPELLSETQVAAYMGVSVSSLQRWRHYGDGPPPIKLGPRYVRYSRDKLIEYLNARLFQSTSQYADEIPEGTGRPKGWVVPHCNECGERLSRNNPKRLAIEAALSTDEKSAESNEITDDIGEAAE